MKRICGIWVCCFMLIVLSACGKAGDSETEIPGLQSKDFSGMFGGTGDEDGSADTQDGVGFEGTAADDAAAANDAIAAPMEASRAEELKQMFGENCIVNQTFEVELSEYSGKVYFVPYAPSGENQDLSIQIIQNGQVLSTILEYVPEKLKGKTFTSLDAVSFFDINYDGCTDILMIKTYGDTSFAAVYYGFPSDADDYEKYFFAEDGLSDNITDQADALTVPAIRNLLSGGKKNGEFADYREAYDAVSRLNELEWSGQKKYDLIYVDDDDIPELAAGVPGYIVSLYTYHDGKVYVLADNWVYGAMGNAGYEYCERKNSLRNYNTDYAGAILFTSYMTIGSKYSMDTVVQIVFYNFDDANGNGIPDESEEESIGRYGVSYIDGVQVTDEICMSYSQGEYMFIDPAMSMEELMAALK